MFERKRRSAARAFLFAVSISLLFPITTPASKVRPVDLETMTRRAGRIFSGRVVDVRVVHDSRKRFEETLVTFEVDRTVKGGVGTTVTIRLFGARDGADPAADDMLGIPSFFEGDEVVIFLYPESSEGLTSPVGLGQGRFRVLRDKQGQALAQNDYANAALFQRISVEGAEKLAEAGLALEGRRNVAPLELLDMAEVLLEPGAQVSKNGGSGP